MTGKIVLVFIFLTLSSPAAAKSNIRTGRSERLSQLLQEAAFESSSLLLAERAARLSALRQRYSEQLEQADFAAQAAFSATRSLLPRQERSAGFRGRIDGVFQLGGNWQSDFGWYFGQNLLSSPAPIRETQSELPTLNDLTLSYGRERSVETTIGLFDDEPLLKGQPAQPLFSGIAVRLHPQVQKLNPQSPEFQFDIEQGWNTLRNVTSTDSQRSKIQRTRPRLTAAIEQFNWNLKSSLAIEWYSDSDSILGRVIAQRGVHGAEGSLISDGAERRWRLFAFSLSSQLRYPSAFSLMLSLERVSNSIGLSSRPAWSAEARLDKQINIENENIKAQLAAQAFVAPSGSIPQARLPLEINPGTQGFLSSIGIDWAPLTLNNHTFKAQLTTLSERLHDPGGWLHCGSLNPPSSVPTTKSCLSGWITLGWSLKLPTNL